jgi:hypothetical protein
MLGFLWLSARNVSNALAENSHRVSENGACQQSLTNVFYASHLPKSTIVERVFSSGIYLSDALTRRVVLTLVGRSAKPITAPGLPQSIAHRGAS